MTATADTAPLRSVNQLNIKISVQMRSTVRTGKLVEANHKPLSIFVRERELEDIAWISDCSLYLRCFIVP
jgi:hypothetical protein